MGWGDFAGIPRTVALQSDISQLNVDMGVAPAMHILDDTHLDDAVDATFQEISSLHRIKISVRGMYKFCAKFKLALARAGRHPSAKLPAVFVSAQLTDAATLSDADRNVA